MNRLPGWLRQHLVALRGLLVFTVICGIAYPVVMWGVAQVAFHDHANGSLVSYQGHVVGSSLLCQEFVDAKGNPAGVDDFLAEAKPEDKMALIKREQEGGKLVAMTGDGTNDAPALAQAGVGGIILPFVGIKLIDLVIQFIPGVG